VARRRVMTIRNASSAYPMPTGRQRAPGAAPGGDLGNRRRPEVRLRMPGCLSCISCRARRR